MSASNPAGPTNIKIDTGGGAYVNGGVKVAGDFVGRDQIVLAPDVAHDVAGLKNPYLGLHAFTYDDRESFAGREAAVTAACDQITRPGEQCTLCLITGASGSGKSSFAQAGLLSALESFYRERSYSPRHAVFRPAKKPLAELADALLQLGLSRGTGVDLASTIGSAATFNGFVQSATPASQVNLVVLDQMEELFSQSDAIQSAALVDILSHLAPFASLRTHVVATLRSDYLPKLFAIRDLYELAKRGIDLREMSEEELRASIQCPLQVASRHDASYQGKAWEPGLVDELARQAAPSAVYLPLLQVSLQELWNRGSLTLAAYTQMGSTLAGAIRERATLVYRFQDYDASRPAVPRTETEQKAILQLFLDLIQVSLEFPAQPDVRRRRPLAELVGSTADPAAAMRARLIDDLVAARLLSLQRQSDVDYVDIIHESLIANWDLLQDAIATERQALQQRARFEQAFGEWLASDENPAYLLTGVRLAEARALQQRQDVALRDPRASDLLQRSNERERLAEQERQGNRRSRHLLQASGGAVGSALGYGFVFAVAAISRGQAAQDFAPLVFLSLPFVGAPVGFGIGIARWLSGQGIGPRVPSFIWTGLAAVATGTPLYVLYLLAIHATGITLGTVATGALIALGLGVGAGVTPRGQPHLLEISLGSLVGVGLANVTRLLTWDTSAWIIAGIGLGALTGLGFLLVPAEVEETA